MEGTKLCVLLLSLIIGDVSAITKDDFPPGFIFGAGTSSYQVEGAVSEDGRKPSIWDTFTHAGRIADNSTADETADQYHKYKEDVKLMHEMGLDAYRFSISWSRLIPDGRGIVNPKGLQYYNNLIDELLSYGIHPHVTIYHFDLPQALEDEYDGQLSLKFIEDFSAFAEVCFKEFGDRVKYWTTFNEPNIEAVGGHDVGLYPPGRCSYPFGFGIHCSKGNSTIEPYIAAHNILLSHASAASLYKDKYQEEQGGYIGMTILAFWFKPFSDSKEDAAATQRVIDFHIGWLVDPLVHGAYPAVMRKIVGSRLPSFTIEESEKLRASFDFIGINHYALFDVQDRPEYRNKGDRDYVRDVAITLPAFQNMLVKKFKPAPLTPWALQKLLEYLKLNYGNPPIMIYENGYPEFNLDPKSPPSGYNDDARVKYLQEYVKILHQSIRNGSNTKGYFVWSFLDCFELVFGYTARFGLYGVDFNGKDKRRYPRLSAHWYTSFLQSGIFTNRETMLDVI